MGELRKTKPLPSESTQTHPSPEAQMQAGLKALAEINCSWGGVAAHGKKEGQHWSDDFHCVFGVAQREKRVLC